MRDLPKALDDLRYEAGWFRSGQSTRDELDDAIRQAYLAGAEPEDIARVDKVTRRQVNQALEAWPRDY